jgi:hypothetical protein
VGGYFGARLANACHEVAFGIELTLLPAGTAYTGKRGYLTMRDA